MRKVTYCVVVLLLFSLVCGCTQQQAPSTGGKPEEHRVVELKYHHHDPVGGPADVSAREWAKLVEEKSGGLLKITIYPSEALGKAQDAWDMVRNGVTDIAWGVFGFFPGRFPLSDVLTLPMLGVPDCEVGSRVLWDLYSKTPYLKDELKDVKVLLLHCGTNKIAFGTVKRPIRTLEDLKGLRLRVPAGPPTDFVKAAGGVPLLIPAPDTYESLQRGVIDGYVWPTTGLRAYRLAEVTNYHTIVDFYAVSMFVVMNMDKWNSLPQEAQKALEECSGAFGASLFGKIFNDDGIKAIEATKTEFKKEVSYLTPEEESRWRELAKSVWQKWIDDGKAKQLPAEAVLEEARRLIALHGGK